MPDQNRTATMRELAATLSTIESRTESMILALEALQISSTEEFGKVWTTLGGIAGLDGLAVGLAEVAEVLGPLRGLVPPTTALPLEPGVAEALATIRSALAGNRETNYQQVPTDFDRPVRFIGQPEPVVVIEITEVQVA